MTLARVTGTVVSTQKVKELENLKLLQVRPVNPAGELTGKTVVAVDSVQAGIGDTVLIIDEGGSAGTILGMSSQPIRTIIAAIVDNIDLIKEEK